MICDNCEAEKKPFSVLTPLVGRPDRQETVNICPDTDPTGSHLGDAA